MFLPLIRKGLLFYPFLFHPNLALKKVNKNFSIWGMGGFLANVISWSSQKEFFRDLILKT
jgi:hypothetical protein